MARIGKINIAFGFPQKEMAASALEALSGHLPGGGDVTKLFSSK